MPGINYDHSKNEWMMGRWWLQIRSHDPAKTTRQAIEVLRKADREREYLRSGLWIDYLDRVGPIGPTLDHPIIEGQMGDPW